MFDVDGMSAEKYPDIFGRICGKNLGIEKHQVVLHCKAIDFFSKQHKKDPKLFEEIEWCKKLVEADFITSNEDSVSIAAMKFLLQMVKNLSKEEKTDFKNYVEPHSAQFNVSRNETILNLVKRLFETLQTL